MGRDTRDHEGCRLTLDAYAAGHGIERIGLLKIDTQGFDSEVAKGAWVS